MRLAQVTDLDGRILPPTIRLSATVIGQLDGLTVSGRGAPNSDIVLQIDKISYVGMIDAGPTGEWRQTLAGPWTPGSHEVQAQNQEKDNGKISEATSVGFEVSAPPGGGGGSDIPTPTPTANANPNACAYGYTSRHAYAYAQVKPTIQAPAQAQAKPMAPCLRQRQCRRLRQSRRRSSTRSPRRRLPRRPRRGGGGRWWTSPGAIAGMVLIPASVVVLVFAAVKWWPLLRPRLPGL